MNRLITVLSLILGLGLSQIAEAQNAQIAGTVLDSVSRSAVVGAYVAVSRNTPDAKPEYVTTDVNGKFAFTGLTKDLSYLVKVSYLSYKDFSRIVALKNEVEDLGTIQLSEAIANLKEVKIVG